jgi:long-chain acyl-CoA synthetase
MGCCSRCTGLALAIARWMGLLSIANYLVGLCVLSPLFRVLTIADGLLSKFHSIVVGPAQSASCSVVRASQTNGVWRATQAASGLFSTPFPGVGTLAELSRRAFEAYADRPCLGIRTLLRHDTNAATGRPIPVFGDTNWLTYKQVGARVRCFSRGLLELGCQPQPRQFGINTTGGNSLVAIYLDTCAEWQMAAQACFLTSLVVTTVYATLGPDAVKSSLEEGAVGTIVLSKASAKAVLSHIFDDGATTLKNVILADAASQEEVDAATAGIALPEGVRVLSFGQVCDLGSGKDAAAESETANLPSPECESLFVDDDDDEEEEHG